MEDILQLIQELMGGGGLMGEEEDPYEALLAELMQPQEYQRPSDEFRKGARNRGLVQAGAGILSAPIGDFTGAMGAGLSGYQDAYDQRIMREEDRLFREDASGSRDKARRAAAAGSMSGHKRNQMNDKLRMMALLDPRLDPVSQRQIAGEEREASEESAEMLQLQTENPELWEKFGSLGDSSAIRSAMASEMGEDPDVDSHLMRTATSAGLFQISQDPSGSPRVQLIPREAFGDNYDDFLQAEQSKGGDTLTQLMQMARLEKMAAGEFDLKGGVSEMLEKMIQEQVEMQLRMIQGGGQEDPADVGTFDR